MTEVLDVPDVTVMFIVALLVQLMLKSTSRSGYTNQSHQLLEGHSLSLSLSLSLSVCLSVCPFSQPFSR